MMLRGIINNFFNPQKASFTVIPKRYQQLRAKHSENKYIYNMNEAYLRYENGDEKFEFTFRYANTDLNIDRQFNLCRRINETTGVFLRRVHTNLDKIMNKKKKKAVKKTDFMEESETEDSVDSGKIALMRNNAKINLDVPCQTVFQDTSDLILHVYGTPYKIKLNVPWVTSMGLPQSILVGFPTYPADFQAMHICKDKSTFMWFRNCSTAFENSLVYQNAWEEIGHGFLYTPNLTDLNCRLKLQCLPANADQTGPTIEAESSSVVQAGPGTCPFETRHSFTQEKLSGKDFRVTSYNILADVYASTEYSKSVLFPYCAPYALAIDYRKQLIIKELIGYNSDIICLQEVDRKIFETDLFPIFSNLNYDGIFNRKGDDLSEGIATFYNNQRFRKISSESRVMSHIVDYPGFVTVWEKIENEAVKERFLARNTTVQATVLRSMENPNEIIVVGNTHLYFQPDADHIRLLQGYYALTYCQEIAREIRTSMDSTTKCNVSILLCGDFNSTPDCGIYQLMTKSHVPEDHKDWSSNAEQIVKHVSLSHESSFASACGTPQYTNYTPEFADCLDYIFYETNNIEVTQVVPFPSEEELTLHQAIPSVVFPSDHIALCADLKWTTK